MILAFNFYYLCVIDRGYREVGVINIMLPY